MSRYEQVKADAHALYARTGKIFSPALRSQISFSAEGFNHLVFKRARKERNKLDQLARFTLLPLALELVKIATTYQEFEETFKFTDINVSKKREKRPQKIVYWSLIAILRNRKIKVVIKKSGNGDSRFWSVIPACRTSKYRDARFFYHGRKPGGGLSIGKSRAKRLFPMLAFSLGAE